LTAPTDFMNTPSSNLGAGGTVEWVPRTGVPFEVENTLGTVPLIPMENSPTLKTPGISDISDVITIQDAINKMCMDMLIGAEFGAVPQKYAIGIEIPKDPQTGRPLNPQQFINGPGQVWASENKDVKYGQFDAADLQNFVKSINMWIAHLAATTRTPAHYLLVDSSNFPSGDSLTAAETGLVAKVRDKQTDVNPAWSEALRLSLRAQNSSAAGEPLSVIWGDAEQRIYSQKVDGALKLSTLGVPQDALWEEIGKTPDEIERFHKMKEAMGQSKNSPEFAEETAQQEMEPAAPVGALGNLAIEKEISKATSVAGING
jgi:hypothetical protein